MKKISLLLVLVILMASIIGCSTSTNNEDSAAANEAQESNAVEQEEDYVMQLAYQGGLCVAPMHIAHELGFFEEEGLKYEIIKSETSVFDLMVAGQVDGFQQMLPAMIQRIDNGMEANIVSGVHTGCLKSVAPIDSPINDVTDLKGKKIGVPGLASSQAIVMQRTLLAHGIGATPGNMEVEFVVYNNADLPLALANGEVDVIALGDPNASVLVENGDHKLIFDQASDPLYVDEYCCIIALRPDFLKNYPQTAAKYLRAMQRAGMYIQENPLEAAKVQLDESYVAQGSYELNGALLDSYNFRPSIVGGREALRNNFLDLQKLGMVSQDIDVDTIVKKVFVEVPGVPEYVK